MEEKSSDINIKPLAEFFKIILEWSQSVELEGESRNKTSTAGDSK
jgi:hypothetical protein